MTTVMMLMWLVFAVLNIMVNGWIGVAHLLIWMTTMYDVIRSNASRRANLDRFYLIQTRWFGVYLHHLKKAEALGVYHTHPWSWFSIVFGSYWDLRPIVGDNGSCKIKSVRFFNACRAGQPHRIALIDGPVWTLCFRGPRRCQWQVQDGLGKILEVEPWTGTENPERTEYVDHSS